MSISLEAGMKPAPGGFAGDRTVFARRMLLVLTVVLILTAMFSIASGATNASAVSVA